jgi:hypothetical protein
MGGPAAAGGDDTFSFKAFGPGSQTCRGSVTI